MGLGATPKQGPTGTGAAGPAPVPYPDRVLRLRGPARRSRAATRDVSWERRLTLIGAVLALVVGLTAIVYGGGWFAARADGSAPSPGTPDPRAAAASPQPGGQPPAGPPLPGRPGAGQPLAGQPRPGNPPPGSP